MKRRRLILICISILVSLLLAGCSGDSSETSSARRHVVTFFEGVDAVYQCRVADGSHVRSVPEAEGVWEDEDGNEVDPTRITITVDMAFHLRYVPQLAEIDHPLLEGDGSYFGADRAISRADAAVLLSSLLEPAGSELHATAVFSDMPHSPDKADAIREVSAYRLMEGYPDGTFQPWKRVTRAEFVTALVRLAGLDEQPADFPDVPEEHWAAGYIGAAAAEGWISGCDDGSFHPEDDLTRAQAAVILHRFLGPSLTPETVDAALDGALPYYDVLPTNWAFYDIVELCWRNDMLRLFLGEMDRVKPGFMLLDERLCHIDGETMLPERYEAGVQEIEDGLYYVSEDGYFIERLSQGLHELDGSMYYVPEDDAPFLTNDYFGYLYFGRDGKYTSGSEVIDEAVEELLDGIIDNDSMSHEQQLYEGYIRLRDGGFFYAGGIPTGWTRGSTGWASYAAEKMYTQHYGTCYYWAAAFLYIARRLGFQSYPVAGGVGTANQLHAWVMVEFDDGVEYICDVELEWAYRNHFYRGTYNLDSMFKQPLYATNAHYIFPSGLRTNDYGTWVTYDDEIAPGTGNFLDIPEDQQYPPEETPPEETAPEEVDPAEDAEGDPAEDTEGDPAADNTEGENTVHPDDENTGENPEPSPQGDPAAPAETTAPTPTPAAEVTASPTPTATPAPTSTPAPTPAPTPEPTAVPAPTPAPTPEPAPEPAGDGEPDGAWDGETDDAAA